MDATKSKLIRKAIDRGADPKTMRVRISRGRIMLTADTVIRSGEIARGAILDAPDEIHSDAALVNIQRARQWADEIGFPCEE